MSKLKQLIDKLCPNGVEYKTLGEIADITKLAGFEFTKYVNYADTGKIIALRGLNVKNGNLDLSEVKYIDNSDFSKLNRSKLYINDMLFTYVGTVGEVALVDENNRYYLAPNVARIRFFNTSINPIFMKYYFQTQQFKKSQLNKYMATSSMKNLTMEKIRKFKVPLPPLEVQNEIVRLLDRLIVATESIKEELSKEIVAQKKQYQYYRDLLLNFDNDINISDKSSVKRLIKELCPNGVEYKKLGDCIIKNLGGGTPSKKKSIYWNGNIPWASVKDVVKVSDVLVKTEDYITEEGLENSNSNIIPKGNIIVATRINPGKLVIAGIDVAINQDLRGLFLKDILNPKYLVYYFQTINIEGKGTTVKGVSLNELENILIPLPPLEVQNKIVEILDRFNTLANDITCGLPAEIELQKKRYEYFRDLLLTFDDCTIDTVHGTARHGTARNGTERW